MVTLKQIDSIIEKCITLSSMKERLSTMSYDEKVNLFRENNKLTPLELEYYERLNRAYNYQRRLLEDEYDEELEEEIRLLEKFDIDRDDVIGEMKEEIDPKYNKLFRELEEKYAQQIFMYDRRIFEKYESSKGDKPIPQFDWDDYAYDRNGIESYAVDDEGGFVDMLAVKLSASRDSIGQYENAMINLQGNVNYTPKELNWLRQYFNDGRLPSFLTYKINGRTPKKYEDVEAVYYEDIDDSVYVSYDLTERWTQNFNNIKYHLDNAIDKSNGLNEPTILYHAGRIDLSLLPGDTGIWDGYKSMSFQEQVMGKHSSINDDYWNIIVLAPTGTKGVCANDERFRGYSFVDEHEYLLGRNTEYTVVSMDYDNRTQVVMLDEP